MRIIDVSSVARHWNRFLPSINGTVVLAQTVTWWRRDDTRRVVLEVE
jgi:hypothetical protein